MARSIWTGSVSFGLVNVPVKAFTAVRDHQVHFNQLEKGTGARIRNEKVSDKTGDPVDADDIEMGYEIKSGRYVTFEKGELEDLRPDSTRTIEVTDFVALDDVDPIYYERTYWLAPDGDTARDAYQLLLAAMESRERVAIGTVVMRNKQYLTAVRPLDGALAMSTMRFADEIVARSDIDEIPSRPSKPAPKALKLATQIIDSLEGEWDPDQYHDTFTEELRRIIKRKDQGKEAVVREAPSQTADVIDLMAALKASVDAAKKTRGSRGKALAAAAEDLLEAAEDEADATGGGSRSKASGSRASGSNGRKKAASKTGAARKAPARKASGKKAAGKKAAAKASTGRSTAKKASARKASAKRATSARKAAGRSAKRASSGAARKSA
jgi:DNA end-binding protein Ku